MLSMDLADVELQEMMQRPTVDAPRHFKDVYDVRSLVATFLEPSDLSRFSQVSVSFREVAAPMLMAHKGKWTAEYHRRVVEGIPKNMPPLHIYFYGALVPTCLITFAVAVSWLFLALHVSVGSIVADAIDFIMPMLLIHYHRWCSRFEPKEYPHADGTTIGKYDEFSTSKYLHRYFTLYVAMLLFGLAGVKDFKAWGEDVIWRNDGRVLPAECISHYSNKNKRFDGYGIKSDEFAYLNFTDPSAWVAVDMANHTVEKTFDGFWQVLMGQRQTIKLRLQAFVLGQKKNPTLSVNGTYPVCKDYFSGWPNKLGRGTGWWYFHRVRRALEEGDFDFDAFKFGVPVVVMPIDDRSPSPSGLDVRSMLEGKLFQLAFTQTSSMFYVSRNDPVEAIQSSLQFSSPDSYDALGPVRPTKGSDGQWIAATGRKDLSGSQTVALCIWGVYVCLAAALCLEPILSVYLRFIRPCHRSLERSKKALREAADAEEECRVYGLEFLLRDEAEPNRDDSSLEAALLL